MTTQPVLDLTDQSTGSRPQALFSNARAWTRATLSPADWTVHVGDATKKELDAVVRQLRYQSLPLYLLEPDHFELSASRATMAAARRTVDEGPGFTVVDRLPLDDWSETEIGWVYWLLGKLYSQPVAQTMNGTMMRSVKNDPGDAERGIDAALTDRRLTYHNDNSGNRTLPSYTSLLCIYPSKEGGDSEYVTLHSLHNALAKEAPAQLDRLFQPFYHDRRGLERPGEAKVIWAPCFNVVGEGMFGRFSHNKITKGYQTAGVQIDNAALDALECVQSIVPSQQLSVRYMMERGQIQIIDNRQGLHYRTDFKDGERVEERRHLLRMWFRDEGRPYFDG
jgi:hypothetical protein